MSNGIEKIALPIIALIFIGAILIYIGGVTPQKELAEPFKNIGTLAVGGAIFIIILIVIVVFIMIYSRAR